MTNIEYINHGVGYRLSDGTIQLNRALKKYPKLHDEVLNHELQHNNPNLTFENVKHDMGRISLSLLLFVITHPSSWMCAVPFRFVRGKLSYDPTQIFNYSLTIVVVTILWKVIKWIVGP